MEKPLLNIVVLENGKGNYDITKPSPEPSKPTAFKLSLEKYVIEDGHLMVDYRPVDFAMEMKGLNHSGKGEMTADVYDLDTDTEVEAFTTSYGGTTYLSKAKIDLATLLNVNMKDFKFTLGKTKARINEMDLNMDGWLAMPKDDIDMDFKFGAPSNNFKDFLSIVPAAYTSNFKDVKAAGSFKFDGFVKGTYNGDRGQYPSFAINTGISNASFQYPSLPMGVTDLNTQINVALPSSNFDDLRVDVPSLHLNLGGNPFDGRFNLRTPVSDPNVDLWAKGTVNLGDLPKTLPLESVQNLSGIVSADVTIKTLMSYIDKKMYDKVNMNGALKVSQMNAQAKGYPSVFINDMAMEFTPNSVKVDNFDAKLGKSDIKAAGAIDNILAFFSTNRTMTGNLTMASTFFDANEWIPKEDPAAAGKPNVGTQPAEAIQKPFDRFDFTVNGKIDRLVYDKYEILNSAASGHFTPNKFVINNFQTKIGNSDLAGKGVVTNAFDWLYDGKTLGGVMELKSSMMDLNQFMTETPQQAPTATNTATEPFVIPKNVDMLLRANMGRVLYTNMDLRNLNGVLAVKNQEVTIEDGSAELLGGRMKLNGGYNTQNEAKPKFNLAFDLSSMDFQQSFSTFNTFQKLAPIGNLIKGRFNTTLNMSGELGKDLSPDLSTLNLEGFLQTIQGFVSGFKPLEEIGNKLNISELKNLDLKDTKNWITVKNGTVTVQEFAKNVKDIALKIAGTHSLTNEMNYTIKAKVPRKKLESNAVGAAAGAAFNNLVTEASKLGLNIKNSEFVNLMFNITGSMSQPKWSMKVLAGDGQASAGDVATGLVNQAVDKAKDSITTVANQKLDEAKDKAKQITDKAVDSATNVVNRKVDEAKDKAIEKAKTEAGKVLDKELGDKVGQKVGDKIDQQLEKAGVNDKVKQQTDKLKDKLDKWDPFGKKKKPEEPKPNNGN